MMIEKSDQLATALNTFLTTSPDVEASAVVSFDGLTMASALPEEMDDDRLGAMAAALLSLGEHAAHGLGRGDLQQLFVQADEGFVFLMSAKDQAVLVAVTGPQAKLGFILYEMRHAAEEVGEILERRVVSDRLGLHSPRDPFADDEVDEPSYHPSANGVDRLTHDLN